MTKRLTAFATKALTSVPLVLCVALATTPSAAVAGAYVGRDRRRAHRIQPGGAESGTRAGDGYRVIGDDPNFAATTSVSSSPSAGCYNEHFGVEVGYTDFGTATENYELPESCNTFGCQSREWTAQMKMTGVQAFLSAACPISKTASTPT